MGRTSSYREEWRAKNALLRAKDGFSGAKPKYDAGIRGGGGMQVHEGGFRADMARAKRQRLHEIQIARDLRVRDPEVERYVLAPVSVIAGQEPKGKVTTGAAAIRDFRRRAVELQRTSTIITSGSSIPEGVTPYYCSLEGDQEEKGSQTLSFLFFRYDVEKVLKNVRTVNGRLQNSFITENFCNHVITEAYDKRMIPTSEPMVDPKDLSKLLLHEPEDIIRQRGEAMEKSIKVIEDCCLAKSDPDGDVFGLWQYMAPGYELLKHQIDNITWGVKRIENPVRLVPQGRSFMSKRVLGGTHVYDCAAGAVLCMEDLIRNTKERLPQRGKLRLPTSRRIVTPGELRNHKGAPKEQEIGFMVSSYGICDLVGFGKTIHGAITAHVNYVRNKDKNMGFHVEIDTLDGGKYRMIKIPKTPATLVLCPDHVCRQWANQIDKMTCFNMKKVIIDTISAWEKVPLKDYLEAEIVLVSFAVINKVLDILFAETGGDFYYIPEDFNQKELKPTRFVRTRRTSERRAKGLLRNRVIYPEEASQDPNEGAKGKVDFTKIRWPIVTVDEITECFTQEVNRGTRILMSYLSSPSKVVLSGTMFANPVVVVEICRYLMGYDVPFGGDFFRIDGVREFFENEVFRGDLRESSLALPGVKEVNIRIPQLSTYEALCYVSYLNRVDEDKIDQRVLRAIVNSPLISASELSWDDDSSMVPVTGDCESAVERVRNSHRRELLMAYKRYTGTQKALIEAYESYWEGRLKLQHELLERIGYSPVLSGAPKESDFPRGISKIEVTEDVLMSRANSIPEFGYRDPAAEEKVGGASSMPYSFSQFGLSKAFKSISNVNIKLDDSVREEMEKQGVTFEVYKKGRKSAMVPPLMDYPPYEPGMPPPVVYVCEETQGLIDSLLGRMGAQIVDRKSIIIGRLMHASSEHSEATKALEIAISSFCYIDRSLKSVRGVRNNEIKLLLGGDVTPEEEILCPITMQRIPANDVALTPCGHVYSGEAIKFHLKHSKSCPVCMQTVSVQNMIYFDLTYEVKTKMAEEGHIREEEEGGAVCEADANSAYPIRQQWLLFEACDLHRFS